MQDKSWPGSQATKSEFSFSLTVVGWSWVSPSLNLTSSGNLEDKQQATTNKDSANYKGRVSDEISLSLKEYLDRDQTQEPPVMAEDA
jgi:hypothetical protein